MWETASLRRAVFQGVGISGRRMLRCPATYPRAGTVHSPYFPYHARASGRVLVLDQPRFRPRLRCETRRIIGLTTGAKAMLGNGTAGTRDGVNCWLGHRAGLAWEQSPTL